MGLNEFGAEKNFRMAWHIGRNTVHDINFQWAHPVSQCCGLYSSQHHTPAFYSRKNFRATWHFVPTPRAVWQFSVTSFSKQHIELHNSQSVWTDFWTFEDASRDLFSLVIIRPSKAMSHGCAAWGACRLSCDLLLYCNVGTIGGVKRKAHAAFATLAEQPCTVAQCLPDLC